MCLLLKGYGDVAARMLQMAGLFVVYIYKKKINKKREREREQK
jgi:hypothetical protein